MSYTYDAVRRLLQAAHMADVISCADIAAHNPHRSRHIPIPCTGSNRTSETSETSREPGTEGKCAGEGGSSEWHVYDTADALADSGIAYDAFGDTTKLSASDAGGSELSSEYYVDGQVFKQSQGEQKLEYKLDPDERTRETIATGNPYRPWSPITMGTVVLWRGRAKTRGKLRSGRGTSRV
jgi:hypothetical protein